MASIVRDFFGWTQVATFSTSDSYGEAGIAEFSSAAETFGISILASQVWNDIEGEME